MSNFTPITTTPNLLDVLADMNNPIILEEPFFLSYTTGYILSLSLTILIGILVLVLVFYGIPKRQKQASPSTTNEYDHTNDYDHTNNGDDDLAFDQIMDAYNNQIHPEQKQQQHKKKHCSRKKGDEPTDNVDLSLDQIMDAYHSPIHPQKQKHGRRNSNNHDENIDNESDTTVSYKDDDFDQQYKDLLYVTILLINIPILIWLLCLRIYENKFEKPYQYTAAAVITNHKHSIVYIILCSIVIFFIIGYYMIRFLIRLQEQRQNAIAVVHHNNNANINKTVAILGIVTTASFLTIPGMVFLTLYCSNMATTTNQYTYYGPMKITGYGVQSIFHNKQIYHPSLLVEWGYDWGCPTTITHSTDAVVSSSTSLSSNKTNIETAWCQSYVDTDSYTNNNHRTGNDRASCIFCDTPNENAMCEKQGNQTDALQCIQEKYNLPNWGDERVWKGFNESDKLYSPLDNDSWPYYDFFYGDCLKCEAIHPNKYIGIINYSRTLKTIGIRLTLTGVTIHIIIALLFWVSFLFKRVS